MPESYIHKKAHTPLESQSQLPFYCAVRVSPPVWHSLCRLHCLKWNWEILQSPFLLLFPPKTPFSAFGFKPDLGWPSRRNTNAQKQWDLKTILQIPFFPHPGLFHEYITEILYIGLCLWNPVRKLLQRAVNYCLQERRQNKGLSSEFILKHSLHMDWRMR